MTVNHITARFRVTQKAVSIVATYREARLVLSWDRSPEAVRHVRTMIAHFPDIVNEGLNEVFVQDSMKRLDFDIEGLLTDADEERPDDN